jgi:hypothetical protein
MRTGAQGGSGLWFRQMAPQRVLDDRLDLPALNVSTLADGLEQFGIDLGRKLFAGDSH